MCSHRNEDMFAGARKRMLRWDLKGKPEECTPEQIKKCHGDVKEHPCVEQTEQK